MKVHQDSHHAFADRYRELFDQLADLVSPATILSFGCSTGEECLALDARFPGALSIVGVEIDAATRAAAVENVKSRSRITISDGIPFGRFDLVLAMSVLCRTDNSAPDCTEAKAYTFDDFVDGVEELDRSVAVGGVLAIFNANFYFEHTDASCRYQAIAMARSGERVSRFLADNRREFSVAQNRDLRQWFAWRKLEDAR